MAALVTALPTRTNTGRGTIFWGPTLVASASETDLSTPDTTIVLDTKGISLVVVHVIFANYTSVTVKAQRSLDATNYADITSATTAASNVVYDFDPRAPYVRLSIAGTLSGSADTMSVYVYMEEME